MVVIMKKKMMKREKKRKGLFFYPLNFCLFFLKKLMKNLFVIYLICNLSQVDKELLLLLELELELLLLLELFFIYAFFFFFFFFFFTPMTFINFHSKIFLFSFFSEMVVPQYMEIIGSLSEIIKLVVVIT